MYGPNNLSTLLSTVLFPRGKTLSCAVSALNSYFFRFFGGETSFPSGGGVFKKSRITRTILRFPRKG